jgi:PAS domain S-box-containing protein
MFEEFKMISQSHGLSLSRRLISRYLMFGLAGVLVCLILSITFSFQGTLQQFVAITAFVPVGLLLLGAYMLWQTVRLNEAIEQQLLAVSTHSSQAISNLKPLAELAPAAIGWNNVIQQLRDQQTFTHLESRLKQTSNSMDMQRWQIVCNSLSEGIVVCDQQGQICLANNAMAAISGHASYESLIGLPIKDFLLAAFPRHEAKLTESLRGQNSMTDLFEENDLSAGVYRVQRTTVVGNSVQGLHAIWTVREITQQKLAEETRNQFVLSATHELRTPLANIKAYSETLASAEDLELSQQREFYNIINSEATRLARFVDELLSVNQMQAGSVTIDKHETDVERLVGEILENMQPQIRQKNQLFECKLPAKMPKLKLDKDKFTACVVNLLGNAVKYTPPEGSIRFVVEVSDAQMHFHIEDTGYGISAEELPRLSEKFFRSSDKRVQKITGSGLGLAFSQEVARLHGGRITIKSELNKGSRFTLSIPLN